MHLRLIFTGTLGVLLSLAGISQATIIGFGQLGGNNATVPGNLGSNAIADGDGYTVANGATPGISLTWDSEWDIHTSDYFTDLENHTVGGGAWDNEGDTRRIGQLDSGNHTIGFAAAAGTRLVLNSFDFAHTPETAGTTAWDLTLQDSGSTTVWSEQVTFQNGMVVTLSPNFVGALGEDYLLTFTRTSQSYDFSNGRHGIDNLSFNQVPEPSTIVLAILGFLGLAVKARRQVVRC